MPRENYPESMETKVAKRQTISIRTKHNTVSHSIEGDLDSYKVTEMDLKLAAVFDGECIRNNDGSYLDGGIKNDNVWQQRYKDIIIYPLQQYDLPNGPIGKAFILKLADEINGVLARKWNMERVLCFISMVLQTSSDIKGTANVKRRSKQRIVEWNEGKFDMLGSSTIMCAEAQMSRK